MIEIAVFIGIIILLALLFAFLTKGRSGHKGLKKLRGWKYAHRGLHGNGVPENSMMAFREALEHGYGIELDIHLLKDGNLAVIHDASLKRTAGIDVKIEDLVTEDLKNYCLESTQETIPTFREVLDLYAGKAPLIVELKSEQGNYAALARRACEMLSDYDGPYCMESFDPRCIRWLYKNRPDVIRGQLSENFLRNKHSKMPLLLKFAMTFNLSNFLTKPDFIAYRYEDRKNLSITLCRKLWHMQGVTWTLRKKEDHDTAISDGWIPIFEGYLP